MARVTVAEVREIFTTTLEDSSISACITAANLTVTNVCAVANVTPALSDAELKEIERWVAAHLSSIQDPISLRRKMGDAESWDFPASVTTAFGMGLRLTPFGQQSLMLDRSGALAALGQKRGSYRPARREDSNFYTPRITKS